ncbi:MAG: DNA translocase FtsK 4TM domain-containing protein, partial [Actinomycetes bacterium]
MAATKTSRARRKPAARSTARRSTSRRSTTRRPARRTPASRRRSTAARTGPSRVRVAWTEQLGGHAADALAVGLAALAALTALALLTDLAGPFGSACQSAITFLAGRGAFLVPVLSIGVAVVLLRHRDPVADGAPVHLLRIGVGLALLVAGLLGLLSLGGELAVDVPASALRDGGGLLGALVAVPTAAVLGTVGAAVILVAAVGLGLLVATGTPLARVAAWLVAAWRTLAGHANRFLELEDEPEVDEEPEPEPAPKPARTRRATVETIDPVAPEPIPEPVAVIEEPEPEPEPEPELIDPEFVDDEPEAPMAVTAPVHTDWVLPSIDLLRRSQQTSMDTRAIEASGAVLEQTLRDFGVDAQLVGMTVGPTVTRYELELAAGVKVNKVTGLSHDIAYALASNDVRILAPIPGRSAIGVEVPNKQRQPVTLGDILASDEAGRASHPLEVGLGRDIAGKAMMLNLATMPHLLIAGQTGAGKSSCINSIITSILMRTSPDQVRLILIDPKQVEMGQYARLPHLLTAPVTNPKKAANALGWAVKEMERRYDLL